MNQHMHGILIVLTCMQTTLVLLEAKLASISGIPPRPATSAALVTPTSSAAPTAATVPATLTAQPAPAAPATQATTPSLPQTEQPAHAAPPPVPEAPPKRHAVKDDTRYSKYFRMLKVGVPAGAVKGKMVLAFPNVALS